MQLIQGFHLAFFKKSSAKIPKLKPIFGKTQDIFSLKLNKICKTQPLGKFSLNFNTLKQNSNVETALSRHKPLLIVL